MTNNSGIYLYCLTEANGEKTYMGQGVNGGSPLYGINYKDIAAIVSDVDHEAINATAENCLLHEKVLVKVMDKFAVLPFELGTVSPGKDDVISLLKDNYAEIKKSIRYLKDKVEINLKALWTNMDSIFKEIVGENRDIALYKKEIEKKSINTTYQERIRIGQLVAQALYVKREEEVERIIDLLKRNAVDHVLERITGDDMVLNAAFLIKKPNLTKFESDLNSLDSKLGGRVNFKYISPLPPFNFTKLKLKVRGPRTF